MNAESIFPLFVDLFLKGAVVLALAMSAVRLWRSASAAARHMVLLAAFILLLLLPLTKMTTPHWGFRWRLPRTEFLATGEALHSEEVSFSEKRGHGPMKDFNWRREVVTVWLAGIVLLLGYRAAGSLQLRVLKARSRFVISDRLISLNRRVSRTHNIEWELRESNMARAPVTWGIWRPVILLPAGAQEWSDEDLTAALLHESGHIRRRDCLTRLLAQVASAIFWMNPLVWMAMRQLHLEQEMACDDLVLGAGISATDYATQLVAAVRSLRSMPVNALHALAMANPSTLEARVRFIVEGRQNRRPLTRTVVAASMISVAAIWLLFTFAEVRAADNSPASDTTKPVKTPANPADDAKAVASKNSNPPVEITSNEVRMENGIAIATGQAVLKWRTAIIGGDVIRYNPDKREVTVVGHGQIEGHEEGGDVFFLGENLVYNLETQKLISERAVENAAK